MALDETRTAGEKGHLSDHDSLHKQYNAAVEAGVYDEATESWKDTSLPVLYLPGTSGNYVSTPDHADLDITGDLDLRVRVAPDDWTPSANSTLISKWGTSGEFSYNFDLKTTGELRLSWSTDGTAASSESSTAATGATDGAVKWVRVTLDVDNGAGAYEVKFYTSDDGETWTQLGSTVTGGATTSINAGTLQLALGAQSTDVNRLVGKFYRGQVYDGIGGTLAADFRGDLGNVSPRFRDSTGKVWTINGSAYTWTER